MPNGPIDDGTELAALRREVERLRAEVDSRDAFLASAAHELRTPIGTLVLHVEGLKQLARIDASAIASRLDTLHGQMLHFARRATTLLDVSMLMSGKPQLQLESVDVASLVREVVDLVDIEANRAGSQLTVDIVKAPIGIFDRTRLEQIVLNLMSNAIKYGAGRPIEVQVAEVNQEARITVRDHGVGIAPEDQQRIFERFQRAIGAWHTTSPGFGVGLWIVRQIVDAMHGTISMTSALGEGSSFTVALPLATTPDNTV